VPAHPAWDWTQQEMELFAVGPNAKLHANFSFAFYLAGEIEGVTGKAALPVLNTFVDMVETILEEIEAESKRLGIAK